jgi:hypothetical protein
MSVFRFLLGKNSQLAAVALCLASMSFATSCGAQELTFTRLDGELVTGQLESIGADGELVGSGLTGLTLSNVTAITSQREMQTSMDGNAAKIRLVDGGVLWATDITIVDEVVSFSSASGINELPLQNVRGIIWPKGLPGQPGDLVSQLLNDPSEEQDTVIVNAAGTLTAVGGLLEKIENQQLMLSFKGKSRPINQSKLVAVVVANLKLKQPTGSMALISLIDGSTVGGVLNSIDDKAILLDVSGGQQLAVPRSGLVSVAIQSDSIAYLSDLEPVTVEQKAIFGVVRPWRKNLSTGGNQITLQAAGNLKKFAKGLGVQSYSRLVFENTNEFDRFRAVAGIDNETNGRGDCQMTVLGDGIELWSGRVQGGQPAADVDVDIEGINQVELIVHPGEQFDLADHADWADARFIRTK